MGVMGMSRMFVCCAEMNGWMCLSVGWYLLCRLLWVALLPRHISNLDAPVSEDYCMHASLLWPTPLARNATTLVRHRWSTVLDCDQHRSW